MTMRTMHARGGGSSGRRTARAAALVVALVVVALAVAAPQPARAGLFSSGSSRSSFGGGSSSFRPSTSSFRTSSSSSYKPVSSGYGYKPTYKPPTTSGTPSFSAPRPGASAPFGRAAAAPPSNFGSSYLGGRPGAGSYGGSGAVGARPPGYPSAGGAAGLATGGAGAVKPGRKPSSMTSLAVPFAVGAGAGALTSAAFRSGQRSCGDGRLVCFQSGCDEARRECPSADASRLARVRCPDRRYAECWAAAPNAELLGGRSAASAPPAFICQGKARPRSNADVVAQCYNRAAAAVDEGEGEDDGLTAGQVLAGDPAYPTSKALAAPGSAGGPKGAAAAQAPGAALFAPYAPGAVAAPVTSGGAGGRASGAALAAAVAVAVAVAV
jgi:hypothetical protein